MKLLQLDSRKADRHADWPRDRHGLGMLSHKAVLACCLANCIACYDVPRMRKTADAVLSTERRTVLIMISSRASPCCASLTANAFARLTLSFHPLSLLTCQLVTQTRGFLVAMTSSATKRSVEDRDGADSNATAGPTPSEEPEQPTSYRQNVSQTDEEEEKKEKKPSKLKAAWAKLDLDVPTLLMMGKAALPPTITLAMYQATDVAQTYTTLGYLSAIIAILGFCIMPRAKFIQTMTMNIIATCIGAALAMLMVWSGVKAREHTTNPSAPPERYNSSQSAV